MSINFASKRLILFPLALCLFLILSAYFLEVKLLVVRQVICTLDGQPNCPPNLISALNRLYLKQPVLSPSLTHLDNGLAQHIKAYHLKSASVNHLGQMQADFSLKNPVISLQDSQTGNWILVAADGTFTETLAAPQAGTVPIKFAATYQPDNQVPTNQLLADITDLVNQLIVKGVYPHELIVFQNSNLAAYLPEGKIGLFSDDGTLTRQVASLHLILAKATIDSSTPVIDLRYEKPVLRQVIPGQSSIILKER